MAGRKIKREYARTEILKIRISKEHKNLIEELVSDSGSTIVSQADIVEDALLQYGANLGYYIKKVS